MEVVTLRREGLRGQAWIIFEDVSSATSALRAENGFTFFSRDIKVSYAREKSDRIAKQDGTFVPKDRRKKRLQKKMEAFAPSKKPKVTEEEVVAPAPEEEMEEEEEGSIPTNILFAQNLPPECNKMMLAMLFRQYAGYQEVRIPRAGLAFVEFDDEPHATLALKGLDGFKLTTANTLDLKYGKITQ